MNFFEKYLGGHIYFTVFGRRVVLFGFNAMHVALNVRLKSGNWFCFHPGIYCFGTWWPMSIYLSPNATPWKAVWGFGKGFHKSV